MRGCLFVLIVAAIVVSAFAWFGAPVLAEAVISGALGSAGLTATTETITATADPPPKLLLGRADRVEIEADGVAFRTFHATHLDLVLTGVDLLGHTADRIDGTIEGAEVTTADGVPTQADVSIGGSAVAAETRIVVTGATVDRVVRATFEDKLGVAITRTELIAPDVLRIVTPGATLEGRLIVDASGGVALSTRLGDSPILHFDPSFPLQLHALTVDSGGLRLDGTLDATALIGG